MEEKPILFSGEMVNAILDGRKTQTRRALKKQPIDILPMKVPNMWVTLETRDPNHGKIIGCRYGRTGDRLWVREAWRDGRAGIVYKADIPTELQKDFSWKPSIHMKRAASRIALQIVNLRAERLQAISAADVIAEGIKKSADGDYWLAPLDGVPDYPWLHPVPAYASLWNELNAKRGYGWDVNPWVWVIEFKVVQP